MFIQEKQHCPQCGKFISNRRERHLCGINAPLSADPAQLMMLPAGFYPGASMRSSKAPGRAILVEGPGERSVAAAK